MNIVLGMVVRDEAERIEQAIGSAEGLCDHVIVLDTGSMDDTRGKAHAAGAKVVRREWRDFGTARTQLLGLTAAADWTLMIDADMLVEPHPDLRDWLEGDPHPEVAAWMVLIQEHTLSYRLPLLTRGGLEWRYEGAAHEHLVGENGAARRSLVGLTLRHDRQEHPERDEQMLAHLMPDVVRDDPRALFYAAQTLWCLGRNDEAIAMYARRAAQRGTFEEERWYAEYMAARLRGDVDALLLAHTQRPWRHEPLTAAAAILRSWPNDDVLFQQS